MVHLNEAFRKLSSNKVHFNASLFCFFVADIHIENKAPFYPFCLLLSRPIRPILFFSNSPWRHYVHYCEIHSLLSCHLMTICFLNLLRNLTDTVCQSQEQGQFKYWSPWGVKALGFLQEIRKRNTNGNPTETSLGFFTPPFLSRCQLSRFVLLLQNARNKLFFCHLTRIQFKLLDT